MAKNDARKNGFEKTNPEDLAAKEEKFRTFFSTSVAQVPDEMKHRDDEKQEPAKQKTQSSILGRILGRAKEEAEPASEKPAMPQELPPTGEIRLGGEDEAAEPIWSWPQISLWQRSRNCRCSLPQPHRPSGSRLPKSSPLRSRNSRNMRRTMCAAR